MKKCCGKLNSRTKKCIRIKDGKKFDLPRKFSKKKCKYQKGFTMRSSCAPYKYCKYGGSKKRKSKRNYRKGCKRKSNK